MKGPIIFLGGRGRRNRETAKEGFVWKGRVGD